MLGWAEILIPFAKVVADKIIMRHVDNYAKLETELFNLEKVGINDQDDVRIVEVKRLMINEREAIAAQLKLVGSN